MSDPNRCARGGACRDAEKLEDGTRLGTPCDRPLCDRCERQVGYALTDAPSLYVQLRGATLLPGQADTQAERVSKSSGSPMPLNAQALHLGEELALLLGRGEDLVRYTAKWTRRRTDGRREGRRVSDSARFLERNLTAWITADVSQAVALLDWRSQVRALPGLSSKAPKALRRYQQPCPACGVRAVTHRAGDDLMHCQHCGATQPYLPTLPREADYGGGSAA